MEKLGPIREYIIMKDDEWELWSLQDFIDNLERYCERNPFPTKKEESRRDPRDKPRQGSHRSDDRNWRRSEIRSNTEYNMMM